MIVFVWCISNENFWSIPFTELNKLSDLRGSFHHLQIVIKDPEWFQEEQPHKLIKVEPEEVWKWNELIVNYILKRKLSSFAIKYLPTLFTSLNIEHG